MHVCLNAFMCTMCMLGAQEGQKRASHPLELQLKTVVSHHMGADPGSSAGAAHVLPFSLSPAPTTFSLTLRMEAVGSVGKREDSGDWFASLIPSPQRSELTSKWGGGVMWIQQRKEVTG